MIRIIKQGEVWREAERHPPEKVAASVRDLARRMGAQYADDVYVQAALERLLGGKV